jgi:hypothetical protein
MFKIFISPVFLLAAMLFFFISVPATSQSEENDWEIWNNYFVDWDMGPDWQAKIAVEFKFNDDMGNHYYSHVDAGAATTITEWFRLGINYRYIEEDSNNGWRSEQRPMVTGTLHWKWKNMTMSDRNRVEYRVREERSKTLRYRNRLMIRPEQQWTGFKIQPYFAGEILYQFDVSSWNQYRLAAGLAARLTELLKMNIYYMLVSSESNEWSNTNILGVNLGMVF